LATSTINITSPTGSDLTIQAPSGFSATIQTAAGVLTYQNGGTTINGLLNGLPVVQPIGGQPVAGSINITAAPGHTLTFADSDPAGMNAATLNLNGGPVVITSNGSSTTVGSGVTVASDSPIVMNVNNGTLRNNGTITSSAPADSASFGSSSVAINSIQAL